MSAAIMERPNSSDDIKYARGAEAYIAHVVSEIRQKLEETDVFSMQEIDAIARSIRECLQELGSLTSQALGKRLSKNGFDQNFSQKLARALVRE